MTKTLHIPDVNKAIGKTSSNIVAEDNDYAIFWVYFWEMILNILKQCK